MKMLIVFFLGLLFYSCSSSSKVIEDFLLKETKINENKNNIITKEKFSFNYSGNAFFNYEIDNKTKEKNKLFKYLNVKYGKIEKKGDFVGNEKWEKSDFKSLNFDLVSFDSLNIYKNNNTLRANNSTLYTISNPFIYREKGDKYLFFYLEIRSMSYLRHTIYDDALIFRKFKGKWVFVERRQNSDL